MRRIWLPQVALLIAAFIWASHNIAGALLTADLHPYFANLLRTTLASLLYIPIVLRYARGVRLQSSHLPRIVLAAVCLTCLFFLFFYVALARTTANQVAMLLAAGPAVTAFLAHRYLNEPLSSRQIFGLLLALTCALIVGAMNQDSTVTGTFAGGAAALLAMLGFSHYTLISKPLLKTYPVPFFLGTVTWIGTALLWLLAPFIPHAFEWHVLTSLTRQQWLIFAYIGFVMNVGSYLLYNYALRRLPASTVHGTTVYSTTVFALIFAQLLLNEQISMLHWVCATLIALGVWLTAKLQPVTVTTQAGPVLRNRD